MHRNIDGLDCLFLAEGIGDFVCTLAIPGLDFITLSFPFLSWGYKAIGMGC
jgi:hypothetical protein